MDENKDNVIKLLVEQCDNGIVIDKTDYCEKFVVEENKSDNDHQKAKLALGKILYDEIVCCVDEFCSCEIGVKIEFYDPTIIN